MWPPAPELEPGSLALPISRQSPTLYPLGHEGTCERIGNCRRRNCRRIFADEYVRTKICGDEEMLGRRNAWTKKCPDEEMRIRRNARTKKCGDEEMRTNICSDEEMRGRRNAETKKCETNKRETKKCVYEEMRGRRFADEEMLTNICATKKCGTKICPVTLFSV